MSISVTFPLAASTGSLGYFEPTYDIPTALVSNVTHLLVTNWGERVMRYDFGGNLREFLFEPQTSSLRSRIAARVTSQLQKWLPFLTITGLFVTFSSEDPNIPTPGFNIRLELSYGNVPVNLTVQFPP